MYTTLARLVFMTISKQIVMRTFYVCGRDTGILIPDTEGGLFKESPGVCLR